MTFDDVQSYEDFSEDVRPTWGEGWPIERHEWHNSDSVTLGELHEVGWANLEDGEDWPWPKFSDEQDKRLRTKIVNRYWDRGIGTLPPGLWKRQFLEFMAEVMPKYIKMYEILAQPATPGQESEWYKSRNIFSDFPQTQLSGNSDYASTGNDTEYERIRQQDILKTWKDMRDYYDVDQMILEDLESQFSCLLSVSINTR
jgi:hypothetical protein